MSDEFRIAVFSDVHGSGRNLEALCGLLGRVDRCVLLGDHASDRDALENLLLAPCFAVRGNCDPFGCAPASAVWKFPGLRVYATHGYPSPDLYRLWGRASENGCRAALFGHTHVPFLEEEKGILLFNPGSTSLPRGQSEAGCGLLSLREGILTAVRYTVNGPDSSVRPLSVKAERSASAPENRP